MPWLGGAVLMLCSLAAANARADQPLWTPEKVDSDTVASVWVYLNHKDCAGAARVLNEGVQKNYPSVLLLAGAMFEDGVCLKANWPRAVGYYERAHAAGHPRAAAKIAAGYAAPAAGQDKAAAVWWAIRGQQAMPEVCRSVAALADDADKFVAAMREWPAQRLDACAYVAGVIGTINGDLEFSQRAAAHGLKGTVKAVYKPAQASVDINAESLDFIELRGVVSGDTIRDRESKSVKGEFERDIRSAADRALRRYTMPAGVDPAWTLTLSYRFGYVDK